jgi:hypothetical protein
MQKADIKLKHSSMKIIAYRARHNELVVPPEPAAWVGLRMVVET